MTARLPHFELCRDDDRADRKPFHVRLVKNGNLVLPSPNYVHKNGARRAIEIVCGPIGPGLLDPEKPDDGQVYVWHGGYAEWLEVRDCT